MRVNVMFNIKRLNVARTEVGNLWNLNVQKR